MALTRGYRLGFAAFIATTVIVGSILLLFTGPPPFPNEDGLERSMPRLRIPTAECYASERYRVLLLPRGEDELEARVNWEPDDGNGSIRTLGSDVGGLVRPTPTVVDKLFGIIRFRSLDAAATPAFVIACPPEAPFHVIPSRGLIGSARVYLAGLDKDGAIGAVPFQVYSVACQLLVDLGQNVIPMDLTRGTGLTIELRITREDNRVVYRWGPNPFSGQGNQDPRLSWGRAKFTPGDVTAGGRGPLIPELADLIERAGPDGAPKVVLLSAGTGVRAVDYLRAAECGGGDPDVIFLPWPMLPNAGWMARLASAPPDARSVLLEGPDLYRKPVKTVWLNLKEGGEIRCKGMLYDSERLANHLARMSPANARLAADGHMRWSECRPALDVALASGAEAYFVLGPLDPLLDFPALLHIPRPEKGAELFALHLARIDGSLGPVEEPPAGRPVRVTFPRDAIVEESLHALARLRLAGVTGFAFE